MNIELDYHKLDSIKLVSGVGDGKTTACIMSAFALLLGLQFNDSPPCVASDIRKLAINLNDKNWWDSDEQRTEMLIPILPLLLGTADCSKEVRERRTREIVMTAARVFAKVDILDSDSYQEIKRKCRAAYAAANAAYAAAHAANAAANAANAAAANAAYAAAYAAYAAAYADAAAANAAYAAAADINMRDELLALLVRICKIR